MNNHKIKCHRCKKTIQIKFNTINEFIDKLAKAGWYDKPAPDPRDGIHFFCKECKPLEFEAEEQEYRNG